MPEIKHDFSAGKMNKDLDERLVPNGEYRHAVNIQVRTTDGGGDGVGDAGAAQNIKGNSIIAESIHYETAYTASSNETKIIASIADEKNDSAYFFVASPNMLEIEKTPPSQITRKKTFVDTIVEVDASGGYPICQPVVVDVYGIIDTAQGVLGADDFNLTQDYPTFNTINVAQNTGSNYRIGMTIRVFNNVGDEITGALNGDSALLEIQNIDGDVLTLYDTHGFRTDADGIPYSWANANHFIFKAPRVLNFDGFRRAKNITGINIINNLLFWTDNKSEPKKINIERCIAGTDTYLSHTQLRFKNPNDNDELMDFTGTDDELDIEVSIAPSVNNDIREEHITVIRKAPLMAPTLHMRETDREGSTTNVYGYFQDFGAYQNTNAGDEDIGPITPGEVFTIPTTDDVTLELAYQADNTQPVPNNNPNIFNNIDYRVNDILKFEEASGSGSFITAIIDGRNEDENGFMILTLTVLTVSEVISSVIFIDGVPQIEGSGSWDISLEQRTPLFELKMGRFGLRYKYEDGEYSNFGPWSELAFLPGPFEFDHKKGYNLGMVNNVRELIIKDFIPHQKIKPFDIVAIDILWKTTVSPNVYVVKTITRGKDHEWDLFTIQPGGNENYVFGELAITTEMIHKILPSSQLLRAWDNVPKTALAQEITANRLVYGNYEQGYDINKQVGLIQSLKSAPTASLLEPKKSIKSIRDYKIGMVFGDKYGRETPVIAPGYLTGDGPDEYKLLAGDVNIEKSFASKKNTFEVQQDWTGPNNDGEPEDWMEYVKYYIKETSNEYYNLVMDRWYYAEDGNIWLSFQSADRNKLDEETYLILKNEHGSNVPVEEKARYKILAIESEAPDFIKRSVRSMGKVRLGSDASNFYSYDFIFDVSFPSESTAFDTPPYKLMEETYMEVNETDWDGFLDGFEDNPNGELEVKISATLDEGTGAELNVSGGSDSWRLLTYYTKDDASGTAKLRWDKPFGENANMFNKLKSAAGLGAADQLELDNTAGNANDSPQYYMDFRIVTEKNKPEFDGKFFVKIEKDDILNTSVLGEAQGAGNYDVERFYKIAYIENSKYNPSDVNSTESGFMPRRNYKWFNESGDTEDGMNVGVASTTTSINNLGNVNIIDPEDANWGDGLRCLGTNGTGCTSHDAEFLALGCSDSDSQGWGDTAIPADGTNDNGLEVVYNRVTETMNYWKWWLSNASPISWGDDNTDPDGNPGLNATIFIDGIRGRHVVTDEHPEGNPPTESNYDGGNWDEVQTDNKYVWADEEEGYEYDVGQFIPSWNGMYYKPTAFDEGRLSVPGLCGPTNGEFGRIWFSTLSENQFLYSEEGQFKTDMTTLGRRFRFESDPNKNIYEVVSSSQETYIIYNSSKYDDNADGDHSFFNNQWNSPGTNGTTGYVGTGMAGRVWFTNNNPIAYNANGDVVADGTGTFVQAGGVYGNAFADSNNGLTYWTAAPVGDGPWDHQDGNCDWCDSEDNWCRRRSFRIEFRRVDPTGNLEQGGTRGVDPQVWDPRGAICHDGRESMTISMLRKSVSEELSGLIVPDAACWETEPKEDVGLDIYYEASNAIPIRLTSENTHNFIPYGSPTNSNVELKSFENGQNYVPATWNPMNYAAETNTGINYANKTKDHYVYHIAHSTTHSIVGIKSRQLKQNPVTLQYSWAETPQLQLYGVKIGQYLVFTHPDGTKTMSKVVAHVKPIGGNNAVNSTTETTFEEIVDANGEPTDIVGTGVNAENAITGFFKVDSNVYKFPVELGWFNCYTWGNGVESDRIRDDFNAPTMDNGVKVSSTFLDYGQERRGSGMIYSGIYNSTSGVNDLNEFNMSDKITKDINPSYGSIQRLKTRDTDAVIFAEDKILKVVTNKDAVYNADGNPQLIASNRVLGQVVPFGGDYGISKNPESLSWDQYRLYFTDKQRGAALRLSRDGLTPISNVGMKTWFRENLKSYNNLLGTFDVVNGEYNLTLKEGSKPNTTISFNEGSKGWVSFKSFIPQTGVSVSGQYITAVSRDIGQSTAEKGIFKHHVDITKNDPSSTNFGDIINRNVFYATDYTIQCEDSSDGNCLQVPNISNYFTESQVQVLFNDSPSSIKSYRTVNYEGSQSRVIRFADETATLADGVTQISVTDNEYYNLKDIDGWYIRKITTDLSPQGASVPDFKEKEGKWFNKIVGNDRGNPTQWENNDWQDLNEFSVQGLGKMIDMTPDEEPDQITISLNSDMVDDTTNSMEGDGSATILTD